MTDLDKLRERYGREISSVDSTALPANHPHYAEAIGSLSPPPEVREGGGGVEYDDDTKLHASTRMANGHLVYKGGLRARRRLLG